MAGLPHSDQSAASGTSRSNAPVRALVVCDWFDERGYGQALSARGFATHLPPNVHWEAVVEQPPSGKEQLGAPLHYCSSSRAEQMLRVPRGLWPAMRQHRPQVVHLHGIWTGCIGLIPVLQTLGAKVVVSFHGMASPELLRSENNWKKRALRLAFHQRCLTLADCLHGLNPEEAEDIQRYSGASFEQLFILGNGVERPVTAPRYKRPEATRFLFCGRFHHRKNVLGVLEAWEQAAIHKKATLTLAGSGDSDYASEVVRRAKALPGVELPGYIDGETKRHLHEQADYSVLFSDSEGQPMATLEALGYGLPPLLSPACRLTEAAEQFGWLAADTSQLARAFVEAHALQGSEYQRRSGLALDYVQAHHCWTRIGARLGEQYQQLAQTLPRH